MLIDLLGFAYALPNLQTLGKTETGRMLFVVFTVRGTSIRVISAREMNRREKKAYESHD